MKKGRDQPTKGRRKGKGLTEMNKAAETKAIKKWLKMVDKPLTTEDRDKKEAEPKANEGLTQTKGQK